MGQKTTRARPRPSRNNISDGRCRTGSNPSVTQWFVNAPANPQSPADRIAGATDRHGGRCAIGSPWPLGSAIGIRSPHPRPRDCPAPSAHLSPPRSPSFLRRRRARCRNFVAAARFDACASRSTTSCAVAAPGSSRRMAFARSLSSAVAGKARMASRAQWAYDRHEAPTQSMRSPSAQFAKPAMSTENTPRAPVSRR